MKPPWSWGWERMTSQYSLRLPTLFPMAWAYSHMIRGFSRFWEAYSRILGIRMYIGAKMSVWAFVLACSYWTGREGSRLLAHW